MVDFDYEWFPSCASTNEVVKRRLSNGDGPKPRIFVAAANEQTNGVGQRGRSWVSLPGNLHLTLGFQGSESPLFGLEFVPLFAGVVIAQWIESEFKVKPTLKWPNDIIVDGNKIGGILCESSFVGTELQNLVIGIGINLLTAPRLDGPISYTSGSLSESSAIRIDAKRASWSLARYFVDSWHCYSVEEILTRWDQYAIAKGHLVTSTVEGKRKTFVCDGINTRGHLTLRGVLGPTGPLGHEGRVTEIASSSEDLSWQCLVADSCLVADVGNSRVKVAWVTKDPENGILLKSVATDGEILELAATFVQSGNVPVLHAVSVNPENLDKLRSLLSGLQMEVRVLSRATVRLLSSRYDLSLLGADRWAQLEAMYYLHSRGGLMWPAMVCSLGTATTLDVIDGAGVHVGGFIVAGIKTSLQALSDRGALLPEIMEIGLTPSSTDSWPSSSSSAMVQGAIESAVGFISYERQRIADSAKISPESVPLILTGGMAAHIFKMYNDGDCRLDSYLTLLGAGILAFNGK